MSSRIHIYCCGKLCSVSGQLVALEKLHIYDCNMLQSVHSLGNQTSLETLFLSRCQRLASLGSGGAPSSYSALQELKIEYCPSVDIKQFNKNVFDSVVYTLVQATTHVKVYCSIFFSLFPSISLPTIYICYKCTPHVDFNLLGPLVVLL